MTRHCSPQTPSSRCGKPTTVLSAWPASEQVVQRDSFTEVSLDELLESSLMNSLAEILGTHETDLLQAQRGETERLRLEQKRVAHFAAQQKRELALKLNQEREARRANIHRMRENLARRNARREVHAVQAASAERAEQELEKQAEAFAFTQEVATSRLTQRKRQLRQMLQGAALVMGLGLTAGLTSWVGANAQDQKELSLLHDQTARITAEAREKVASLEAQLAALDTFAIEQKQDLELSLEAARIELAQAEKPQQMDSFQGSTQPPKQGPRRLAQDSTPKAPAPPDELKPGETTSPGQLASSSSPYESLNSCEPNDPMCFEL